MHDTKSQPARQTASRASYRTVRKRVRSLRPSPENETLYRPVDPNDPEIRALAESIQREGLHEPLIITADGYIVSGHRRLAALKLAGQLQAPCRVLDRPRSGMDNGEFLALLRDHNRHRNKSAGEVINETIVDINTDVDPGEAMANLIKRRERKLAADSGYKPYSVALGTRGRRHAISDQKAEHVRFVKQVVFEDWRDYWPLDVRRIHYGLLNYEFHRNIPQKIRYRNDQGSYDKTSDLCTRLRLAGEIPWEAIADQTRPVHTYRPFGDVAEFINREADCIFHGYWRDLLQSQPDHIEVLVEKNTALNLALGVTKNYQIPTSSARGFNSIDSLHEIYGRYYASGRDRLVLIVLSDFDPEGERIAANAGLVLRDDFGAGSVEVVKAGVTRQQIESYNLPKQNFAKESSTSWQWFVERNNGDDSVYELEALDPADLQRDLNKAIRSALDLDLFESERDREASEAVELQKLQGRAKAALKSII